MPIEFRCNQCGKLLRTGDDTAGKQAKCPSCGSIQAIPLTSQGAAPAPGAFPPLPSGLPGTPFGPFGAQPSAPASSPFGDAPPAVETMNPYQSPSGPSPFLAPASGGAFRPTPIDIGTVLSKSWEAFGANYWNCVGVLLIVGLLNFGAGLVQQVGFTIAQAIGNILITILVLVISYVASVVVQTWINIGQVIFLLKLTRHGEGDFGAIFAGGRFLGQALLSYLVVFAISIAVSLACAVPAVIAGFAAKDPGIGVIVFLLFAFFPLIYLSLAVSQAIYLIVDQGLGPIEAVRASFEVTKGNKLSMFVIGLAAGLFASLGIIACCIGVIFTAPFVLVTMTVMYLCMTGQVTATTDFRRR